MAAFSHVIVLMLGSRSACRRQRMRTRSLRDDADVVVDAMLSIAGSGQGLSVRLGSAMAASSSRPPNSSTRAGWASSMTGHWSRRAGER